MLLGLRPKWILDPLAPTCLCLTIWLHHGEIKVGAKSLILAKALASLSPFLLEPRFLPYRRWCWNQGAGWRELWETFRECRYKWLFYLRLEPQHNHNNNALPLYTIRVLTKPFHFCYFTCSSLVIEETEPMNTYEWLAQGHMASELLC